MGSSFKRISGGFAFPSARVGSAFGVIEEYNFFKTLNKATHIDASFGLDVKYNPVKPAILLQDEFMTLSELLKQSTDSEAEFNKFLSSHKPVYSLNKSLFMLIRVSGNYNESTDSWTDDTIVRMFLPKRVVNSNTDLYVLCSEVCTNEGISTVKISENLFESIRERVLNYLKDCGTGRSDYLKKRMS